jgi:hypothetical protein
MAQGTGNLPMRGNRTQENLNLQNLKNKKNKKKNNNKNTRVIGVWDFSLPVVPHPKVTACWSVKAC